MSTKVPWETIPQIDPKDLEIDPVRNPGPYRTWGRGNGHIDIYDANDQFFAHVFCWEREDYEALDRILGNISE